MTFSLLLPNIADAISKVSITGVTVKDKDEIAASWVSQPNVLFPSIEEWLTGYSERYDSILEGAEAPVTVSYTLHYRFLGTQIGDVGTWAKAFSDVVDKVVVIVNAIIDVHAPYSGRVRMKLSDLSIGGREDPAGNQYHGADISFDVEEMQN